MSLAEATRGIPAASEHPESGAREDFDDILNVPRALVVPAGQGPSQWAGDLMVGLPSFDPATWIEANGTATSFTAEFECINRVTAQCCQCHALRLVPWAQLLLQIFTTERHPDLGSGALLVPQAPAHVFEEEESARCC